MCSIIVFSKYNNEYIFLLAMLQFLLCTLIVKTHRYEWLMELNMTSKYNINSIVLFNVKE